MHSHCHPIFAQVLKHFSSSSQRIALCSDDSDCRAELVVELLQGYVLPSASSILAPLDPPSPTNYHPPVPIGTRETLSFNPATWSRERFEHPQQVWAQTGRQMVQLNFESLKMCTFEHYKCTGVLLFKVIISNYLYISCVEFNRVVKYLKSPARVRSQPQQHF